jgi:hypothetical protein
MLMIALAATLVCAARAHALPRTYVSIAGSDANDCSLNNACRTFAGAASKTDQGGVLTALDSGTYGSVTITYSLTVQAAPGIHITNNKDAGIRVSGPSVVFYVSNTMIAGNATGLLPSGGQIISFGNNRLADNTTNGAFTSTIPQQ